jgi:hypothetical protein
LAQRRITHFVTLATNDSHGADRMVWLLDRWLKSVNRRLLGTRWLKKGDEWMISYFFPGKLDVNAHWHGLVELLSDQFDRFETEAPALWEKLVPSGDARIDRIGSTEHDRLRVSQYAVNHIAATDHYEAVHVGKFIPRT